jgi:hypothetical protein
MILKGGMLNQGVKVMSSKSEISALANDLVHINELLQDSQITEDLTEFINEARVYLLSQSWCLEVEDGWLAEEWEGILSVFLFKIKPKKIDVYDYVWIIVGDIPPAYIDIESAKTSSEALYAYCFIMKDWAEKVIAGKSIKDCFPINVEASEKHANMLLSRIGFIESNLSNE